MSKTLFYYLKKNLNKSFDELPLNEIDHLIFASLGFLNNAYFYDEDNKLSFNEIYNKKNMMKLLKGAVVPFWDYRLIRLLSKSSRYKDFKLYYSRKVNLPLELVQYGIVDLYHDKLGHIVVFEGTNACVYGALEDLRFGTSKGPKSFEFALEDLNRISSLEGNITLVGHSKGGSVAEYLATHADEKLKERIVKAYNFDGPGFYQKEELNSKDLEKITKYITEKSIFGVLLNTNCNYSYVKAKSFYLLHHMVYSWKIKDNKIIQTNKLSSRSKKRVKALNEFLSKHDEKDIEIVISHSISIMQEFNMYKPSDIRVVSVKKGLKQLAKSIKGEDKELIIDFVKKASIVFLP